MLSFTIFRSEGVETNALLTISQRATKVGEKIGSVKQTRFFFVFAQEKPQIYRNFTAIFHPFIALSFCGLQCRNRKSVVRGYILRY